MFGIEPNPYFIKLVKDWAAMDDIILVLCRSGVRSAISVNLMAKEGFCIVHNIIDGMTGGMVKDPENALH